MDNVFEAAAAYTNSELNNYTRLEDFYNTTTITNRAVEDVGYRLSRVEASVLDFHPYEANALGVDEDIIKLKKEVDLIKEVLIDIQMMLRTFGLDDMSRRMGDLNTLLL